jgi:creatinine amidohydrolase
MKIKVAVLLMAGAVPLFAQDLPSRWDELTASDWPAALEKSARTCLLPLGILEKHGPHAPMGADLIQVREVAARAVKQEYAVTFPDYFYGQIYEARHQPGTFALPSRLTWELLDATCEEIARNGFKKIVLLNGHGGNPDMLRFFVQSQLERRRDYVVYLHDYDPMADPAAQESIRALRKTNPAADLHAGEKETSTLLFLRPELVQLDRAGEESGADQRRWAIPGLSTAIWWYARFPNHYAGEGDKATPELGEVLVERRVQALVAALRAAKADLRAPILQQDFFDHVLGEPR